MNEDAVRYLVFDRIRKDMVSSASAIIGSTNKNGASRLNPSVSTYTSPIIAPYTTKICVGCRTEDILNI
ncbi:unnamed protein product [Anisakis simplex]|uniref:Uncharacterized protein n=1 Tax=Anisakis simplex TaxID=6269 RepID=A0A0M3JCV2_ANISI|nr:unnamed protein product [Anisakis simplex]